MKTYRPGAVGALMDEYERAAAEFSRLVGGLSDADYELVRDEQTQDAACRSIQTIVQHVIAAGYGYSLYIREALSIPAERPTNRPPFSRTDSLLRLAEMMEHSVATLEGRWQMSDAEMEAVRIHSRWGVVYDLEQMLEHAIVHILRHRRQIERFLQV